MGVNFFVQWREYKCDDFFPVIKAVDACREVVGRGSVTINIGWYVVSTLHDQPSCNIDITWPVESRLWVDRVYSFFWWVSVQNCCFPFWFRYYMIGISCNIETT